MDNFPLLTSFVLPLLIALLGAVPAVYLLIREWKRGKRQDMVAEMTAAGEITDAAANLVEQLRKECVDLRVRLTKVEGVNQALTAEVTRLSAEVVHQAGLIDRQEASLREQERVIAQQNVRISDLEVENSRLRTRNEELARLIEKPVARER